MDGRSQVLLDVKLIQLAHNRTLNTGITPPQQVTAFNVYAEEQSILNANQASGSADHFIGTGGARRHACDPGNPAGFRAGLQFAAAEWGDPVRGGLTLSGITPKPFTANLNLNSSDSRELDQFQMRLGDGEDGTLKSGSRYPIETSSFSSVGGGNLNIPGLNSAGNSGSLSSLLGSLGAGPFPTSPWCNMKILD